MFNVGGGELLVIFLVALIVLGPAKLPEVARQIGGMMREVRKISSGFQDEMRAAMDDPVESAARDRGHKVVATSESPAPSDELGDPLDDEDDPHHPGDDESGERHHGEDIAGRDEVDDGGTDQGGPVSTAAAAGMYDIVPSSPSSTPNPYLAPVGTRAEATDLDAADDPDDAPEADHRVESDTAPEPEPTATKPGDGPPASDDAVDDVNPGDQVDER